MVADPVGLSVDHQFAAMPRFVMVQGIGVIRDGVSLSLCP